MDTLVKDVSNQRGLSNKPGYYPNIVVEMKM